EEGVTQVFRPLIGADWIVGVVGQLQLDVLKTRLESEYNLPIDFEPAPFITARWCESDDGREIEKLLNEKKASLAKDGDGNPVFLARNMWDLDRIQQDFEDVRFSATRERSL
ncbi:MAG: peptide chain release factor 3, partial [Pseudomonadota bacterium]